MASKGFYTTVNFIETSEPVMKSSDVRHPRKNTSIKIKYLSDGFRYDLPFVHTTGYKLSLDKNEKG